MTYEEGREVLNKLGEVIDELERDQISLQLKNSYIDMIDGALDKTVEIIYDNSLYSCIGNICTLSTASHEPEVQKKICCKCLKARFIREVYKEN